MKRRKPMNNVRIAEPQKALDYALYMISTSYFKKAVCKSKIVEGQLKMAHGENKRDTNFSNEEQIDNYFANQLEKQLPAEIFGDIVEVRLIKSDNKPTVVEITGFDWQMELTAKSQRGRVEVRCEFSMDDDAEYEIHVENQ